jgi:hypothetical protein
LETTQRRDFGVLVGGVFLLIGCWPIVFTDGQPRWWSLVVGASLVVAGWLVPTALGPVYRAWMMIGRVLGWINTSLLLGMLFYGLMTPMGVVMRFLGRDPMRAGFDTMAETYRVPRRPRPGSHMQHQF